MTTLNNLPDDARVWVYQSNRELPDAEVEKLKIHASEFVQNWFSHGSALAASAEVFHNRFIVIGVDEKQAAASGCSIDKSVAFIKQTELEFNINLLDRMQIAYLDGTGVKTFPLQSLTQMLERAEITENAVVFNNLVSTKKDWEEQWKIPMKESWILQRVQ